MSLNRITSINSSPNAQDDILVTKETYRGRHYFIKKVTFIHLTRNTDKPTTPSKPATPDKPATPSNPTTSDKPATPNKSATADKLVSSSKSSTADKPALANRPTVKDESAKSTTTAPLSTSTSSNSNKSVDPVLSKKENVSALTKGKSKTTEPTTDLANGKRSEVKSADYNSSLPQTNNKSSLAGILAGSAMIATMSKELPIRKSKIKLSDKKVSSMIGGCFFC